MSGYSETNVRIAPCALEALSRITARRGTSRDETVRQLLTDHLASQEQKPPEDRLTHISTVLRYPRPPRWRGDPRTDVPLRVRAPASVLERARAVSLRLPGQHPRAYRDYQGRMLTDAVTTAIACAEPFDDDFLTGLTPLLRHGAALGLWRLAAAATSTRPEKAWLQAATALRADLHRTDASLDFEDQHILRVAEALEQEESWHALTRFESDLPCPPLPDRPSSRGAGAGPVRAGQAVAPAVPRPPTNRRPGGTTLAQAAQEHQL
ncbi:serine/threonine-protein kinase [Streptomyces massasporeus]|uniref:hypothetical protein n=1 Tax=Streptomyces massasporeus TaxID=67324 RepID=UPI00369081C2